MRWVVPVIAVLALVDCARAQEAAQPSALTAPPFHDVAAKLRPLQRIAFGSCNRVNLPQPLWPAIIAARPDLWIWGGDIIYADTTDDTVMAAMYLQQQAQPGYAQLHAAVPVIGVWDDHDFGGNDADADYPNKSDSQRQLLDFLGEPAQSPRRSQQGVYTMYTYGPPGRSVAVILLDGRYFREEPGANAELLGPAQWQWLERTLRESAAQIHVIVSGIQVLPTEHRFDKWANWPAERARLLALFKQTQAAGPVIVSGDRHIAEISCSDEADLAVPLCEVTSSGLTHAYTKFSGEPNRLRVGAVYADLNFGTLTLTWHDDAVTLAMAVHDRDGAIRVAHAQRIPLAAPLPRR